VQRFKAGSPSFDVEIKGLSDFVKAYFLANLKQETEHDVAQKKQKMIEVTEVTVTYGFYYLIVRIEAATFGHLDKIITEIRQIKEIERTTSLIGS
jgi:DNA-binding Lrp family transcriptional regulator